MVEDEYYQAQDCCEWLRSAGALVAGPARSYDEAKHILDRVKVDAAVVDINLTQGPDFQVASQLTRKGVPFIFATGYDKNVIPAEFQQALTIQKPFGAQNLIAAVTSLRRASTQGGLVWALFPRGPVTGTGANRRSAAQLDGNLPAPSAPLPA